MTVTKSLYRNFHEAPNVAFYKIFNYKLHDQILLHPDMLESFTHYISIRITSTVDIIKHYVTTFLL